MWRTSRLTDSTTQVRWKPTVEQNIGADGETIEQLSFPIIAQLEKFGQHLRVLACDCFRTCNFIGVNLE